MLRMRRKVAKPFSIFDPSRHLQNDRHARTISRTTACAYALHKRTCAHHHAWLPCDQSFSLGHALPVEGHEQVRVSPALHTQAYSVIMHMAFVAVELPCSHYWAHYHEIPTAHHPAKRERCEISQRRSDTRVPIALSTEWHTRVTA